MRNTSAIFDDFRDAVSSNGECNCICWVGSLKERDPAFTLARVLAESKRCQVVMCLDSPARLEPHRAAPSGRQQPLTPEVIAAAEAMLQRLYGSQADTMVLPGNPITEMRRYAERRNVGIVVMGVQALGVEHEYGQRFLDDAPCAVLLFVSPSSAPIPRSSSSHRGR